MRRKPTSVANRPSSSTSKPSWLNYTTLAIIGGVFILGIGIGLAFSSTVSSDSGSNVYSREFIDRSAPNAELCAQFGASAIVTDTRIFVTLNPFSVYVTQPKMQPGCVLRSNNWSILEQRKLVNGEQVRSCKQRMNTFGYTGALESSPQIDCVYRNDNDQNRFNQLPGSGGPPPAEPGEF
ncbi:DUF3172 domain-containing protein [Floridanema evergladense]|uniref:DUF3172 domain-containing protein n=1 Tax=Floridaenema evergladense BLCC-F167 TaxID=3153639 RepID=A0ABV4WVH6_9CYAN